MRRRNGVSRESPDPYLEERSRWTLMLSSIFTLQVAERRKCQW